MLYYGHYDVQPADPIELWDHEAFDPVVVDSEHGRKIVAGAVDDKYKVMTFIEAFRAFKEAHGTPPQGQGPARGGGIRQPESDPFLEANTDRLAADVCVVSDTGMWDIRTPAITTMPRWCTSRSRSTGRPATAFGDVRWSGGQSDQ